jgi:DNA modification methylase
MILTGDARAVLPTLAAASVDCCVTSPPYFGLRDYGVAGQIGLEPTPEAYVAALVEVFRQVRRVLRADGTLWLNLGDSYAGSWGNQGRTETRGTQRPIQAPMIQNLTPYPVKQSNTGKIPEGSGLKPKDLCGIPWRVAFALQADGWYLRSDIIWAKPNPMPESVTDRPTKAHEYVFLLSKQERYYYDADAIAERCITSDTRTWIPANGGNHDDANVTLRHDGGRQGGGQLGNPDTRNKRTVWTFATLPTPDAHFATYPIELPEICIRAGSRENGTVLDPFAGSGTTGLACVKTNRKFVGVELNPEYVAIADRRLERHYSLFAD